MKNEKLQSALISLSEDEIQSLKEEMIDAFAKMLKEKQLVASEAYAKQLAVNATENIFE